MQNAGLNEVNEEDGVTYLIEMNAATAAAKGLASGDTVRLTSTPGYSIEGKLACCTERRSSRMRFLCGGHLGRPNRSI